MGIKRRDWMDGWMDGWIGELLAYYWKSLVVELDWGLWRDDWRNVCFVL